jgi:AcrR family transcriptional regulator
MSRAPIKAQIRRRPRASAIANRRSILDAALEIFSTYGYEGTTTRAIAKRARLKQGHLAKYFPTKEALWRATIEEFSGEIIRVLDDDFDHAGSCCRSSPCLHRVTIGWCRK